MPFPVLLPSYIYFQFFIFHKAIVKISIITICKNSASTIESTIKSVINQSDQSFEYIIVDGCSNDSTLEIIEQYKSKVDKFVSEPDSGLYDAMNKGIELAEGEIIGFINSDDYYVNEKVIENIRHSFIDSGADSVYGDIQYVDKDNPDKVIRNWVAGKYNIKKFFFGWMPPHPSFFVKSQIYKKFGKFNLRLRFSADYELMLRFLLKHRISAYYFPQCVIKMRIGGQNNKSLKNRLKANYEDRLAWKINKLKGGFLASAMKPVSKIHQYFFKDLD